MLNKEVLVENVFKKYNDPEVGVDVWTMGLIYNIDVKEEGVKILMTFTSPMCPLGPQMIEDLKTRITEQGAKSVDIEITFDPPWKPSEELKEMMGMMV